MGGIILNRRNVKREQEKVEELAQDLHTRIIADLPRSDLVPEAEEKMMTVVEGWPESAMAEAYRMTACAILQACGRELPESLRTVGVMEC